MELLYADDERVWSSCSDFDIGLNYVKTGLDAIRFVTVSLKEKFDTLLCAINKSSCRHIGFVASLDTDIHPVLKLLELNSKLTTLDLSFNTLGVSGSALLSEALCANFSLVSLNLNNCSLTDDGGSSIAEMLRINDTLQILKIKANQLSVHSYQGFTVVLAKNKTLLSLEMHENAFTDEEINALLAVIVDGRNQTLLNLFITDDERVPRRICSQLERNRTNAFSQSKSTKPDAMLIPCVGIIGDKFETTSMVAKDLLLGQRKHESDTKNMLQNSHGSNISYFLKYRIPQFASSYPFSCSVIQQPTTDLFFTRRYRTAREMKIRKKHRFVGVLTKLISKKRPSERNQQNYLDESKSFPSNANAVQRLTCHVVELITKEHLLPVYQEIYKHVHTIVYVFSLRDVLKGETEKIQQWLRSLSKYNSKCVVLIGFLGHCRDVKEGSVDELQNKSVLLRANIIIEGLINDLDVNRQIIVLNEPDSLSYFPFCDEELAPLRPFYSRGSEFVSKRIKLDLVKAYKALDLNNNGHALLSSIVESWSRFREQYDMNVTIKELTSWSPSFREIQYLKEKRSQKVLQQLWEMGLLYPLEKTKKDDTIPTLMDSCAVQVCVNKIAHNLECLRSSDTHNSFFRSMSSEEVRSLVENVHNFGCVTCEQFEMFLFSLFPDNYEIVTLLLEKYVLITKVKIGEKMWFSSPLCAIKNEPQDITNITSVRCKRVFVTITNSAYGLFHRVAAVVFSNLNVKAMESYHSKCVAIWDKKRMSLGIFRVQQDDERFKMSTTDEGHPFLLICANEEINFSRVCKILWSSLRYLSHQGFFKFWMYVENENGEGLLAWEPNQSSLITPEWQSRMAQFEV